MAAGALALVNGFMLGVIWQSQLHLRDLRRHIEWVERYTQSVSDLLAAAFPDGPEAGE